MIFRQPISLCTFDWQELSIYFAPQLLNQVFLMRFGVCPPDGHPEFPMLPWLPGGVSLRVEFSRDELLSDWLLSDWLLKDEILSDEKKEDNEEAFAGITGGVNSLVVNDRSRLMSSAYVSPINSDRIFKASTPVCVCDRFLSIVFGTALLSLSVDAISSLSLAMWALTRLASPKVPIGIPDMPHEV